MNTIGENLWGGQNVLERDLKGLIRGSHLRNVLGLCLFAVAFYFAYRYGMAFSHVTSSPFWFPDSVLLCTLLVGSAEPVVGVYPRSASDSTAALGS